MKKYTKKQIQEAIEFWGSKLNEGMFDYRNGRKAVMVSHRGFPATVRIAGESRAVDELLGELAFSGGWKVREDSYTRADDSGYDPDEIFRRLRADEDFLEENFPASENALKFAFE